MLPFTYNTQIVAFLIHVLYDYNIGTFPSSDVVVCPTQPVDAALHNIQGKLCPVCIYGLNTIFCSFIVL